MRPAYYAFSIGALLLLAGCQSAMNLRNGRVVLEETSAKPADQVAGCIGDKIESQNTSISQTTYSTRPTADGFSISGTQGLSVGTDTILLIDISRTSDGTRVKMYTHFLVGDGPAAYFAAVRGCV